MKIMDHYLRDKSRCFLNFVCLMKKCAKLPTVYIVFINSFFLFTSWILDLSYCLVCFQMPILGQMLAQNGNLIKKKHLYLCVGIVLQGLHRLALRDIALLNPLTKQNLFLLRNFSKECKQPLLADGIPMFFTRAVHSHAVQSLCI